MAHQEKRYCRGCKCIVDASLFDSNDKQYKQCDRCRARIHKRKRNETTIVCDCGSELLRTSLRDHLRTLHHEKRMAEQEAAHNAEDVARTLMRKPMSAAAVRHHLKTVFVSAPIGATKMVSTPAAQTKPTKQTKIVPLKATPSFLFRKAKVAAPMTVESLLSKLKTAPVLC